MPALGLKSKEDPQAETFSFFDDAEFMNVATAAWQFDEEEDGFAPTQPSANLSTVLISNLTHDLYAVLINVNGVLGVYRKPCGTETIIREDTWPEGLVSEC